MNHTPPFVANSADNLHCANAVFRMVHQYFFGHDFAWKQIDNITHAIRGKATWTFVADTWLAKKGLKVINIESTDYEKLYRDGVSHLSDVVGKENAHYYLTRSNVASVIPLIPQFLTYVQHETRRATTDDIVSNLKKGNLVGAEVNSRILNHGKGFDLHLVLLYKFSNNYFFLHDPGLPPHPARRVSVANFAQCFSYPGAVCGIDVFGK
jgi:hypothetical protein